MTITMYSASAPRLVNILKNLAEILRKAEAHALARKIDPAVLLSARLYPAKAVPPVPPNKPRR